MKKMKMQNQPCPILSPFLLTSLFLSSFLLSSFLPFAPSSSSSLFPYSPCSYLSCSLLIFLLPSSPCSCLSSSLPLPVLICPPPLLSLFLLILLPPPFLSLFLLVLHESPLEVVCDGCLGDLGEQHHVIRR